MDLPFTLFGIPLPGIVALLAGLLILFVPRILNYVVALYLLLIGAFGLLYAWQGHPVRVQALIALLAGILVLVRPAILNYVVGIYLVVLGILELGLLRL